MKLSFNIHSQKLTLSTFNDIITLYMPRAKAVSDETKPKRATTSRAPRRVKAGNTSSTPVRRKAPTVIPVKEKKSMKSLMITVGVFMVIVTGSAFVGMADSGQINVSGVIQERGQTLRDEGREQEASQLIIPKSDGERRPNGGLQPVTGNSNLAPTPAPVTLGAEDTINDSTSTASTTTEMTEEAEVDTDISEQVTEVVTEPEAEASIE